MDLFRRDAFAQEVLAAALFGDEEDIRDGIREEPVDLLRHGAVKGAEPRLDVGDRNVELHGRQSGGQSGVDVPHDKHEIRPQRVEDRLEAAHDFRRLHRVRPRPDTEVEVR